MDAATTDTEVKIGDKSVTLMLNLPASLFKAKYPAITSKLIGKVPRVDMFMENPDGTGLDITSDFNGKPVNPARVLPGPFQNIKRGKNTFTIWPHTWRSR